MTRNYLEHYFHIQTWSDGPNASIQLRAPGVLGLQKFPDAKIHAQKAHAPRRNGKTPALIIVRDPRDVVVSLVHFNRDIMEVRNAPLKASFRSHAQNKSWSNFHLYWLHQRPVGNVEFIKYEDCLQHIKDGTMPEFLQGALDSLGIQAEIQTEDPIPSFKDYQKVRPKFYRRGVAGGWKAELPSDIAELCWKVHGPVAKTFGYTATGA